MTESQEWSLSSSILTYVLSFLLKKAGDFSVVSFFDFLMLQLATFLNLQSYKPILKRSSNDAF